MPEEYQLFVLPDDLLEGDMEEFKCGGCNWRVSRLYVYAKTEEEAIQMYKDGEAGLCGSCICDILVESNYRIKCYPEKGEA